MKSQKAFRNLIAIIILAALFTFNFPKSVIAQAEATGQMFLVVTTNDSGEGSLRNAMTNAKAGDIIRFDPNVFPESNPQSIIIDSVFPYLTTGSITIDGSGAGVILDGSRLVGEGGSSENPFYSGLIITSDRNLIRNLTIINFPGNGVFIQNGNLNIIGGGSENCETPCNIIRNNRFSGVYIEGGGDNSVTGNFLGLDSTGTEPAGNGLNGVRIMDSSRNIVGGLEPGTANIIGANSIGIEILEAKSIGNKVLGNIIGLDKNSQKKVGNIHAGISIAWSTSENYFEGNVIAGNEIGIVIEKDSHNNVVKNNFIGTNQDLTSDLGNNYAGVILASSHNNVIGPGNNIMWNGNHGIVIEDSFNLIPYGNKITENTISNNLYENMLLTDSISDWVPEPRDLKYSNGEISGFTVGNQEVELYTDKTKQGGRYLATVIANDRGYFYWIVPASFVLDGKISALSFEEDGTTSLFSTEVAESQDIITALPGVVGPTQVSKEPKVLYWNFIFAVLLLGYCKVMTNLFNKILKKYGEIVSEYVIVPIQRFFNRTLKNKTENMKIFQNRWANWAIFLIIVSLIQAWLNPAKVPLGKHLSIALSILICSSVIGLIKEVGERILRKRIKQPFVAESTKVHWFGIIIAGITTAFSRMIQFTPGFILGSVEVFSYKPSIKEKRNSAIRILVIRGAIFVITLVGWLLSSLTETFSPGLTSILQMIFTVALQSIFFELLPLSYLLDGSILIRWNFWSWFGLFLPVSYFTFWLIFNPNGSGIKAIQQNSISTLIIVLFFLSIVVLASEQIFKRIEQKSGGVTNQ